jgi:tetratricopeptide (TPR) repeat protein
LELRVVAARALAGGDALAALGVVGPFGGPHALALRGIALAQMGDHPAAKAALERAARTFAARGAVREEARARAAAAEVALALRELGEARQRLTEAAEALERAGDPTNAAWTRLVLVRATLLEGQVEEADGALALAEACAARGGSAVVRAVLALARAERDVRLVRASDARNAAREAVVWARRSGHRPLVAETERLLRAHDEPVVRLVQGTREEPARLADLEEVLAPRAGRVVVDGLRRRVLEGGVVRVDLGRRPVLFGVLEALARAHPDAVSSAELARAAFGARVVNGSHHQRLRVEVGRLRAALGATGLVRALGRAYRWELGSEAEVLVVAPLEPGNVGVIRALLADGAAWSASSLAKVTGKSPRTVQRALAELVLAREVEALGEGPARRYSLPRGSQAASQVLLLGLVPWNEERA